MYSVTHTCLTTFRQCRCARGSNGKDLFHTRRFDFCHSTGGTNIINSGSVPVKCPSKPCQWANMNNNEGQQAQLNWMQSLLMFGMQVWTHYKATGDWGKQWCTCTLLYVWTSWQLSLYTSTPVYSKCHSTLSKCVVHNVIEQMVVHKNKVPKRK